MKMVKRISQSSSGSSSGLDMCWPQQEDPSSVTDGGLRYFGPSFGPSSMCDGVMLLRYIMNRKWKRTFILKDGTFSVSYSFFISFFIPLNVIDVIKNCVFEYVHCYV